MNKTKAEVAQKEVEERRGTKKQTKKSSALGDPKLFFSSFNQGTKLLMKSMVSAGHCHNHPRR